MNKFHKVFASIILILFTGAVYTVPFEGQDQSENNACRYFADRLEPVPHLNLKITADTYRSFRDTRTYTGCKLTFVTSDSLLAGYKDSIPRFQALEGTELYRMGWRMNDKYTADGPGTGVHGIEKDSTLCLVLYEKPAYLDDNGEIQSSETITLTIECREKRGDQY